MNRIVVIVLALAAATASTAALAQHHAKPGFGKHARGGITSLDANADGRIARSEVGDKGRHAAKLARDFDAIDANRDGYIVRTEMRAWHERLQPQRQAERQKRFEARYVAADLNGDGKLSKLEVGEKMPRLQQRFAWMDDNRDGFLSRAELQPHGRRGM